MSSLVLTERSERDARTIKNLPEHELVDSDGSFTFCLFYCR